MIKKIVGSIVTDGITDRATSFVDKQIDVDQKRERLNELLIQINSAIEFAKAHEPIQNSWLCKWLEDLQNASREGAEVQSVFEEKKVASDTRTMNLLKFPKRLFQRGKNIDKLNYVVTRLERKASGCEEFLRRLRYEFTDQQHETYTKTVGKLERTVALLRNSLRPLNSNGKFKRSKKTKLDHGPMTADYCKAVLATEDITSGHAINVTSGVPAIPIRQPEVHGGAGYTAQIGPSISVSRNPEEGEENHHGTMPSNNIGKFPNFGAGEEDDNATTAFMSHQSAISISGSHKHKDENGRPLPEFGDWDVNDPASAEGFTVILNKAKGEKKGGNAQDTISPMKDDWDAKVTAGYITCSNSKNFVKYFFRLFRCIIPSSSASTRTQE